MRILLLGGSGLVGSHVLAEAKARNHIITATYRNFAVPGLVPLDLADATATRKLLEDAQPDWVVHAAGWTWVDGCEKDPVRAQRENCEQPAFLAQLCHERNCRFAFFSTTYVFDGTAGPYSETDQPNPLNVYARSKWAAEQQIQEILSGQTLIPRIICVWGREAQQKNFVYQTLKALREGRTLRLPSDQIGNPTWAGDIAWWLLGLMELAEAGVWNLAGDQENCDRGQWFSAIRDAARALGLAPADPAPGYEAIPTAEFKQPALRPLNSGARIQRIQNRLPRQPRSPADLAGIF
jgi:dTDP-4-dehydrorhamnose reductase